MLAIMSILYFYIGNILTLCRYALGSYEALTALWLALRGGFLWKFYLTISYSITEADF